MGTRLRKVSAEVCKLERTLAMLIRLRELRQPVPA
jgi:hypothetical protein